MRIEKRSLNWLPKPSLYAQASYQRAKQKAAHQSFVASTSSLTSTVSSINTNQVVEMGNIVSKVALARMGKKV